GLVAHAVLGFLAMRDVAYHAAGPEPQPVGVVHRGRAQLDPHRLVADGIEPDLQALTSAVDAGDGAPYRFAILAVNERHQLLSVERRRIAPEESLGRAIDERDAPGIEIGRASCRERVRIEARGE